MKKILFVTRPVAGGMAEHLRTLIANLDSTWQVTIAGPERLAVARPELYFLPLDISASLNPIADWPAIWQLRKYLQKQNLDLIHAHGAKAGLIARLAALGLGLPIVVTAHNLVLSGSVRGWKTAIYRGLERMLARQTAGYIAVSRAIAVELEQLGVKASQIKVIYNGIADRDFSHFPLDRQEARKELGIGHQRKVIGTVARFAPQKGLNYFVEMAEILRGLRNDCSFLVIGDGPLRPDLERLVQQKGLKEHFIFTGQVADIRPYLKAMDAFVLPSISEGLGLSLLEAMAAGIPVVATRVGGIPEVINDGVEGWLVSPGDGQGLAERVVWVLDHPREVKIALDLARERVQRLFSVQSMLEQTQAYYEKIISEGKRH